MDNKMIKDRCAEKAGLQETQNITYFRCHATNGYSTRTNSSNYTIRIFQLQFPRRYNSSSRSSLLFQKHSTPSHPCLNIPDLLINLFALLAGIDCSKLQEKHVELKAYSQRRAKHTTQTHSKQQPSGDGTYHMSPAS